MSDILSKSSTVEFIQGHACIIGVGADLPDTVADAKGLAQLLKDPERCAYPQHQLHLLTETSATRSNIITTLETLAQTATPESTVLIYFSGHGYQVFKPFKSYYLMPYGYSVDDLSETALSGGEFTDLLREIPSQKLLVILDCCHAGGLADASGFEMAKAPLPPEAQRMFARGGGRIMIGSSLPDEQSFTGKPYSMFTHALMQGFCGKGAAKQDGYVRATDLAMYTREAVPKWTGDRQHPMLDIEKADNFVLAYYAGGQTQPKGLPPELADEPTLESKAGELSSQNAPDNRIATTQNAQSITNNIGDSNNNITQNVKQRSKYGINTGTAQGLRIGDTYGINQDSDK